MNLPVAQPQTQEPQLTAETLRMLKDRRFNGDYPPVLSDTDRARVAGEITQINDYLAPASSDWILARVATALAHYYVNDLPEYVQMGIAADWLIIMQKHPAWAVEKAFLDWVENEEKRKPTPAGITKKAAALAHKMYRRRDRMEHCLKVARQEGEGKRVPPTEAEKENVAAMVRALVEGSTPDTSSGGVET